MERIEELQAEIDVLRAYVQALLGFIPRAPQANEFIANVTRNLHAQAQRETPDRKEALDRATARMNAMAHTMAYKGPS